MKSQFGSQLGLLLIATLLISTSGALGRYIEMPAPVIVWWRCALASIMLWLFCKIKGVSLHIDSKKIVRIFMISSILLGAHWITYFYALKMTNVAIGMLTLFTFPVLTALLEPLFFKTKLDLIHVLLGLLVLIGIYFLVPDFDFEGEQFYGVCLGLISALFYAFRNLLLKPYAKKYDGTKVMFYQVAILSLVLLPILLFMDTSGIQTQYPYVILLALVTTAIGHSLFVKSLKYFKVSTASIIGSAQPVFGIIIAYIFLNETPSWSTFIGGSLILLTVVIESLRTGNHNSSKLETKIL